VPELQIRATWRSVAGVRHGQFKQEKQIKEGITSGATTRSNSWVPRLYARAHGGRGGNMLVFSLFLCNYMCRCVFIFIYITIFIYIRSSKFNIFSQMETPPKPF
jgi:hypothetical protein